MCFNFLFTRAKRIKQRGYLVLNYFRRFILRPYTYTSISEYPSISCTYNCGHLFERSEFSYFTRPTNAQILWLFRIIFLYTRKQPGRRVRCESRIFSYAFPTLCIAKFKWNLVFGLVFFSSSCFFIIVIYRNYLHPLAMAYF